MTCREIQRNMASTEEKVANKGKRWLIKFMNNLLNVYNSPNYYKDVGT